jgi:hypothetical protein
MSDPFCATATILEDYLEDIDLIGPFLRFSDINESNTSLSAIWQGSILLAVNKYIQVEIQYRLSDTQVQESNITRINYPCPSCPKPLFGKEVLKYQDYTFRRYELNLPIHPKQPRECIYTILLNVDDMSYEKTYRFWLPANRESWQVVYSTLSNITPSQSFKIDALRNSRSSVYHLHIISATDPSPFYHHNRDLFQHYQGFLASVPYISIVG